MAGYACFVMSLVFMTGCISVAGSEGISQDQITQVRAFIEETMACRNIPGLTLAIVKDDASWEQGFGLADVDTESRVDPDTRFGIGSATKSFTMTLLGILLEEHGFTWSSKLSEVLGREFMFVDQVRSSEMTLRDLLSHRTGLAGLDAASYAGYDPNVTSRADLAGKMHFLPAAVAFRDRYLYNNIMYMLLGYICEQLGGATWENLLETRLLAPLEMTSSFVLRKPRDLQKEHVAQPYLYKDGRYVNGTHELYSIFPEEPAGAIMSSASDMAKWVQFYLAGGETRSGKQLLNSEMLAEALQVTVPYSTGGVMAAPEFPVADTHIGYGYAWSRANYRGYSCYEHGGSLRSYTTSVDIYPDVNLGIFLSTSVHTVFSRPALNSILYYISDVMLHEEPWLNTTTTCSFPQPWQQHEPHNVTLEETGQMASPRDYEGLYDNPLFPDVNIKADVNNTNMLLLDMGRIAGVLRPSMDADRFLLKFTAPWEVVLDSGSVGDIIRERNVTFKRSRGVVESATFSFEADFEFRTMTSTPSPPQINGARRWLGSVAALVLIVLVVTSSGMHV